MDEKVKLRDFADGYINIFIKAKDTEVNESIHEAFKEFAKIEAGYDYTVALKRLLDNWNDDVKYDILAETVLKLTEEVEELKKGKDKKEESEEGFF